MKCKICGKRCNSLPAMSKHYRKKHPGSMKRRPKERTAQPRASAVSKGKFCPHCGGFLG